MYTFDHDLFLALNFDGGPQLDRIMLALSGTTMWLPLYALILWLVWRRTGWRGLAVFTAAMIAALALSDMVSGIFKHNGLLGGLLMGIIEIFAKAYISTQLSDAVMFVVLIIVLLFKPAGLLGKEIREKV